ncbi:MAG: ATP-binding protein [Blastocatellales bacterium]
MARTYCVDGRCVDLTDSGIESIHTPGHTPDLIQPHGALIVLKEPELTMLQVSANTGKHFGFEPEELLNQPLALLLGETKVEDLRDRFLSRALETTPHYLPAARIGKEDRIFKLLLHRDQGLLILECEPKPDEEAENHIIARKVEEMARLNAELERSNIELDSFAYMASHDLKEPLRGIHNYSRFLIEDYADKLDEAGVEKLQTLIMLTQRMEALVDSLLYYSRVGRDDLAVCEVDLDEVLDRTLEMIEPRLRESGAEIRRPLPLPVVRADHARVGEIFHNLIVNAIKYNDKPRKWVEIGFEERVEDKETRRREDGEVPHSAFHIPHSIVFYVRDNGIGIPESQHETIFGIFKRLHGRDEFGGGVGAGLTIVKKIVERHNGRIWVESRVGEGATFFFTLC